MDGNHWINGTIGVRFARGCHPDDLWVTYFTSSKVVQEYRKEYGEPDVIQIRQTFNDSLQAREWEHKVLKRMKVVKSERWLNKSEAGKKFYCLGHNEETKKKLSDAARNISEETRKKLSAANKGKPKSEEHRQKMSAGNKGENNPFYGKTHTEETRQKISESQKGRPHTEETRRKIGAANKGTVPCLDIHTGIKARIPSELFHSDKTRYFHNKSKIYKHWNQNLQEENNDE